MEPVQRFGTRVSQGSTWTLARSTPRLWFDVKMRRLSNSKAKSARHSYDWRMICPPSQKRTASSTYRERCRKSYEWFKTTSRCTRQKMSSTMQICTTLRSYSVLLRQCMDLWNLILPPPHLMAHPCWRTKASSLTGGDDTLPISSIDPRVLTQLFWTRDTESHKWWTWPTSSFGHYQESHQSDQCWQSVRKGWTYELYKVAWPKTIQAFHDITSSIWKTEILPDKFRDARIVSLYKNKGSKADCGNYWGISLFSTVGKILAWVILNYLINISEDNLPKTHCGFRPDKNAVTMVFTVWQDRKNALNRRWTSKQSSWTWLRPLTWSSGRLCGSSSPGSAAQGNHTDHQPFPWSYACVKVK